MNGLPPGWTDTRFEAIADIQLGKMLDKAKNLGDPTPYLRNINVRWGEVDTSDVLTMPMSPDERAKFSIHDGDVLVCEGGEPGRAAVWRLGPTDLKFQKAILRVRAVEGINPEWLAQYLSFATLNGMLTERFTGTTIKHLPREALQNTPLPLPPIAEQRRILAKINTLSAKSKRARDHLDHALRLVERYRSVVLGAAFQGDLASAWRAVHALSRPATRPLGEVVTEIRYGTAQKCELETSGTAVLRIPNVSSGSISLANLKYAQFDAREYMKLRLEEGDVLVIRSNGSVDLVGRPAIVTSQASGMAYAGYLIRLRADRSVIDPKFMTFMLGAPQVRAIIEVGARSTSGVHNINTVELASLMLPIPTLAEQRETVRRIETAFAWINRLGTEASSARKLIDHFDQAVLSKAFRGELVPQDPNDEPASMMLERIKVEMTGAAPARRGRGRPRLATAT